MESISVLSNAKINLFFAINGIHSDGFCAVSSILLPVDFGDSMTFSLQKNTSPKGLEIFQHSPLKFPQKNNTIIRAVELFCEQTGIRNFSLRVDVGKKIPIGSGFGGGSSNAICTLKALNQFYNFPLSEEYLTSLAKKIGADCSFFIKNSPQLASGRGEILSPLPIDFGQNITNYSVLLFCPDFSISTQWAYDQFRQNPTFYPDAKTAIQRLLAASEYKKFVYNSFQDLVLKHYPKMKALFSELQNRGHTPCLTGSGSGCFIIHRDKNFLESVRSIILEYLPAPQLLAMATFKHQFE
ncbi:MAG: 4-(cytidine 5'-diphospho)-2-C-methyl-D-erythritol kinase [Puniceicoccales bacterium]|jgi:4-diphosphocytidyl-2-C-methyl-D-erythritol kinase|nr:4-(cytidine 5'-diphospho)-2-C-methyl-D-erythritol kinase [Puniceicoccales bacterium]